VENFWCMRNDNAFSMCWRDKHCANCKKIRTKYVWTKRWAEFLLDWQFMWEGHFLVFFFFQGRKMVPSWEGLSLPTRALEPPPPPGSPPPATGNVGRIFLGNSRQKTFRERSELEDFECSELTLWHLHQSHTFPTNLFENFGVIHKDIFSSLLHS